MLEGKTMGLDLATIVGQLRQVEARHPDTAAELEPIISALTGAGEATLSGEQARMLLGVGSIGTITRWLELGILKGEWDAYADRWRIPLTEVLRLRATHRALGDAGGDELSQDELETLSATRPGRFPWQARETS